VLAQAANETSKYATNFVGFCKQGARRANVDHPKSVRDLKMRLHFAERAVRDGQESPKLNRSTPTGSLGDIRRY
jgi:hypothetical protein